MFDLELANYIVDFNRQPLDRETALVTGVVLGYEFANKFSLLLGPGIEFEKNENLFLVRTSIEYDFEIDKSWSLFPSFNFDYKEEYNTWSLNIGISKKF